MIPRSTRETYGAEQRVARPQVQSIHVSRWPTPAVHPAERASPAALQLHKGEKIEADRSCVKETERDEEDVAAGEE